MQWLLVHTFSISFFCQWRHLYWRGLICMVIIISFFFSRMDFAYESPTTIEWITEVSSWLWWHLFPLNTNHVIVPLWQTVCHFYLFEEVNSKIFCRAKEVPWNRDFCDNRTFCLSRKAMNDVLHWTDACLSKWNKLSIRCWICLSSRCKVL